MAEKTNVAELFKDRRVQIGTAVVALALIGSGLFFALGNQGTATDESVTTDTTSPMGPGFAGPDGPGPGVGGTMPGGPGAPGTMPGGPGGPGFAAGTPGAPPAGTGSGARTPGQLPTSFDDVPAALGGPAQASNQFAQAPPAGAPGGFGSGAAAPSGPKPDPIRPGRVAAAARRDPFESFFRFVPVQPPAYSFALPLRLARYPRLGDPIANQTPEQILGPLPFVERRVAGVLFNGQVSAILETGTPGPAASVDVVQPGARVPSGIPGLDDFVVSSITPTQVTLRSNDGRSTTVKLTALPPALADQLRSQAAQSVGGAAGGGFPGGPGGFGPGGPGGIGPGGPGGFGPGGPAGGGRPGGFGPGGGAAPF